MNLETNLQMLDNVNKYADYEFNFIKFLIDLFTSFLIFKSLFHSVGLILIKFVLISGHYCGPQLLERAFFVFTWIAFWTIT